MLKITRKFCFTSVALLLFILVGFSAKAERVISKSGKKPHWVSWSRAKTFKSIKNRSKNRGLEKGKTYLFMVKADGVAPTYHIEDVEDIVRLKAASRYGSLVKSIIEEFLISEKNISDTVREAFLHKTNTLKYSVQISGFLLTAEYWETTRERKVKTHHVYMQYAVSKKNLKNAMSSFSKEIGFSGDLTAQLLKKQEEIE